MATTVNVSGTAANFTTHPWVRFAARRLGRLVGSVLVLVSAAFLMIHLIPGDPVRGALGPATAQSVVDAQRESLGLNDPLWQQYLHFLQHLFTGNLGTSITTGLPVSDVIRDRLPATLQLAVAAFLVAVLIALPVGLAMGVLTRAGRRPRTELTFTSVTVVMAAIPEFLLAVGLVYLFAVKLHWLPVAGRGNFSSYLLPVLSLSVGPAAVLARICRVELLAVLQTDYLRTARAKRLPAVAVYLRHALPNAVTATITLGGLLLGGMVAGTVLVENVFSWPGLGSTIVSSILAKDYPLVQGVVLIYGAGVLLVNLTVDVVLALLDPRSTIRES
ncbi:ABC transporter permease [Kribbella qitaiheensis]|uniref:ABC transporter permease n=1 Tax=Kribbella qitaiheensis TaxID=1544730 RepID=A0A7G6WUM1_9ACTN|nr:ABC transporter permease [Kribbella qitaiheensis]QNE17686.1 ABC transporter permease [Kribbella qitaiheensis]